MAQPAQHIRASGSMLAAAEKRVLQKLAAALPPWVMPDHLTGLGLLASTLVGIGYMYSNQHAAWLWLDASSTLPGSSSRSSRSNSMPS